MEGMSPEQIRQATERVQGMSGEQLRQATAAAQAQASGEPSPRPRRRLPPVGDPGAPG